MTRVRQEILSSCMNNPNFRFQTPSSSVPFLPLAFLLCMANFGLALARSALFTPVPGPVVVQRGSGPLLLADVNHDGYLDLVTKHLTNRSVSVLLGDGHGRFTPAADKSLNLDFEPAWIAIDGANHGKMPVLAVASKERSNEIVRVFLADANGRFSRIPTSEF